MTDYLIKVFATRQKIIPKHCDYEPELKPFGKHCCSKRNRVEFLSVAHEHRALTQTPWDVVLQVITMV